jgi:hypothetical protein
MSIRLGVRLANRAGEGNVWVTRILTWNINVFDTFLYCMFCQYEITRPFNKSVIRRLCHSSSPQQNLTIAVTFNINILEPSDFSTFHQV